MRKANLLVLIGVLLSNMLMSAVALGQTTLTATTVVEPGFSLVPSSPNDFTFDQAFLPSTSTGAITNIYRTLDPNTITSAFVVDDSDPTRGFRVTASASNFVSSSNPSDIFSYSKFAFVTLSDSLTEEVDGQSYNTPPGAPNANALQDCNWDPSNPSYPNMEDFCDGLMTPFDSAPTATADVDADFGPTDTSIVLDTTAGFNPSGVVEINDDMISYAAIAGSQLTGVTGIDTTHVAGSPVTQKPNNSDEYDIMDNSSVADTGRYSIGFGFRTGIPDFTNPGSYNGTITFTLISI